MTDNNNPPPDRFYSDDPTPGGSSPNPPAQSPQGYPATPPPNMPPPGSAPPGSPEATPPGSWAPQPGMPQTPPPGQNQWQGTPPPTKAGYPSFPTTPPPGAKSGPGIGRILAIVAGVVVVAIVGLGIIGAIVGDSTGAAYIEVGECFAEFSQFEASVDGGENQTVDFVDGADCAEPHALEAYFVGEAYAGIDGAYSQDTIDQVAIGTCESEFEAFVNHEWETSELDYWWLTPSVEGWEGGDRELICLIGEYERDLTVGTLRNAGR